MHMLCILVTSIRNEYEEGGIYIISLPSVAVKRFTGQRAIGNNESSGHMKTTSFSKFADFISSFL